MGKHEGALEAFETLERSNGWVVCFIGTGSLIDVWEIPWRLGSFGGSRLRSLGSGISVSEEKILFKLLALFHEKSSDP